MTIEQKAKAYDEALELARDYYKANSKLDKEDENLILEDIFPELAESEDEKIRKELITHCRNTRCVTEEGAERIVKWISWLERQKPTVWSEEDERMKKVIVKILSKKAVRDSLLSERIEISQALEWIQKQGEQKPADKVEPKFKVGDYVVGKYISGYITEVRDDCYLLGYQGFAIDKQDDYHLWTIEDAKDGDVLVDGDNIIGIFDGIEGLCWHSKCFYSNFTKEFYGMGCSGSRVEFTKPATKEQRDLLYQKMKEAGYEWDAEKKEFNKIQQQPIDKIEPKFKVGDIIKPKDGGHEPWQIMQVDILDKKYRFKDGYVIHFSQEDNYELVKQSHKVAIKIYDSVPYEDDLSGVTHQQDGDSYIVEYEGTRAQGGTTPFNHLFVYIFGQEFAPPYPALAPWHWKDVGKFTRTDGKNAADGVDKVESKFKTGDWVVSPNGVYWHVDAIRDGRYQVSSNSGESADWPLDTNIYHRFTFRDAKDGDVLLSSDGSIFIFKEVFDLGCKHYIALEEEDGTIQVNDNFAHCWESVFGVCPATKEQRDTLEKAMADAGYTFDFEKKELKKIEDKPLVIDEGKAEMDRCFTEMMSEYHTKQKSDIEMKTPEESLGVDSDTYNKIVDECVYGEQKPVEWKQENVEELSDFENAMMHIGGSFFGEYAGLDPNDTASIKEQAELLLELAPKTDWSEEDEAKLKSACALIRNTSLNGNEGVVDSTIDWLKSLKKK